jgi:hypothetical protein
MIKCFLCGSTLHSMDSPLCASCSPLHSGVGDRVWWNDPDGGFGSGYFTLVTRTGNRVLLQSESDTVIASAGELLPSKPDNLMPVVLNGQFWGYAASADQAKNAIARFGLPESSLVATFDETARIKGLEHSRGCYLITVNEPIAA